MSSLVARTASRMASLFRSAGTVLDGSGKGMEVTKFTEKLVPSTRFVALDDLVPTVSDECFVAPSASVIGDVTIGKHTSVWYGAIIRGDVHSVKIGEGSSIGDRAVVHVAKIQGDSPTVIGNHVTISSGAMVHAATLGDGVMIGESAQVLDGAAVGDSAMVAPGSIVTAGTRVPGGELWGGAPAKKIRALTEEEIAQIKASAFETIDLAAQHVLENAKEYKEVVEEEEEEDVIEHMQDENTPKPNTYEGKPLDIENVLGQGAPGRIFRSNLTHPEEMFKSKK
mmetsp:Transcript_1126/g.1475  ORF Transcript_1126/g.1475 Transcript_1126/m.1475 type:complete len:282 (-) Transcript_1126:712-1557(-)|eukprot:CAMPEP_0198139364 /NCGR_PEP_ID=MMETSP1443-20131203/2679_1 /TAXON_ID=186043 /ORGANISM="Entomoneis sp., Strain CCMP2396" /LENGTH=281 /DNA_ID=CAMNT_0043801473 /DNA_START=107 /DNA_END=952 /DNA_ORIENTATION=-